MGLAHRLGCWCGPHWSPVGGWSAFFTGSPGPTGDGTGGMVSPLLSVLLPWIFLALTLVGFYLSLHATQDLLCLLSFFFSPPVLINLFIIFRLQKQNKLTKLSLLLESLPKINNF